MNGLMNMRNGMRILVDGVIGWRVCGRRAEGGRAGGSVGGVGVGEIGLGNGGSSVVLATRGGKGCHFVFRLFPPLPAFSARIVQVTRLVPPAPRNRRTVGWQ